MRPTPIFAFRPWNETFSFPQKIAKNFGHFDIYIRV